MKNFLLTASAFSLMAAASIIPAKASIVLTQGGGGTGNNIVLNTVTGVGTTTLTTTTNKGVGVTFTSNEDLTAAASGQAVIQADTSSGLFANNDFVEWYLTSGQGTTKDVFNVTAPNSKGANGDKNAATAITVFVNGSSTPLVGGSDVLIPNDGFFTLTASGGDVIDSIKIVFNGDVTNVEQFRITATPAVPEASTWGMMILGFLGLGFMAYWRRGVLQTA